jgi:hypothetical protein
MEGTLNFTKPKDVRISKLALRRSCAGPTIPHGLINALARGYVRVSATELLVAISEKSWVRCRVCIKIPKSWGGARGLRLSKSNQTPSEVTIAEISPAAFRNVFLTRNLTPSRESPPTFRSTRNSSINFNSLRYTSSSRTTTGPNLSDTNRETVKPF